MKNFYYGIRPTSDKLHLGHMLHILHMAKRIKENFSDINKIYILLAESHAEISNLTKSEISNNSSKLLISICNILTCYVGKEVIYKIYPIFQNDLEEYHKVLTYTALSCLNVNTLLKNPIFKTSDNNSVSFLTYPILQAFDVLLYLDDKYETTVFVGNDQSANVNIIKDIFYKLNINKFRKLSFDIYNNVIYDYACNEKMSKSIGNTVDPLNVKEVLGYIKKYKTYPREKIDSIGNPIRCDFAMNIAKYLHSYFGENTFSDIIDSCSKGKTGCVSCKNKSAYKFIDFINKLNITNEKYVYNDIDIISLTKNFKLLEKLIYISKKGTV